MLSKNKIASIVLLIILSFSFSAWTDEGMWLYNQVPYRILQSQYGFEPSKAWLEHLQKSSVRFNSGGSGSFVSPNGLVMTNHHVAADCLQKLSTPEKNYVRDGYYARTREEEVKCHDLELNVLMEIIDVTDQVKSSVKKGMTPEQAEKARRAALLKIEKEWNEKTGLRSDVVTLYRGALYHLYQYKKYTDVRLVFAPEADIAFFGGDPDNFEYPRYDLDVTFFRAYEDNKPASIQHYLAFSAAGAREGDLVFVSGHPGRTDRLNTVEHLQFLRDLDFPLRLNVIRRREVLLLSYSARSLENARRARDDLFGYQNSRKARLGQLAALQDPAFMAEKARMHQTLQEAISKDPKKKAAYGNAWDQTVAALKEWKQIYHQHFLLEQSGAFNSRLFWIARTLVRMAQETSKPNEERLREYGDANLASLRQQLFSEAPIYKDLETLKLGDSLSMYLEMSGTESSDSRQILQGKSPQKRAQELVYGTRLEDVAFRKQLHDGGMTAITRSEDPMIQLALLVDPSARRLREVYEQRVEEPLKQAYEKIANAIFETQGINTYPDATFTLRLAFGKVAGYKEGENIIAPFTTLEGTYRHAEEHNNFPPFQLPRRWIDRKDKIQGDTPFNFVCTADIIGGNSGSPVVNQNGEVVGLIFDGNLQSLVFNIQYTEEQARAIAVDSRGIIESLQNIYEADSLVEELTAKP